MYKKDSNWLDNNNDCKNLAVGDTFQRKEWLDTDFDYTHSETNNLWYQVVEYSDCGQYVYSKLRGMGYTRYKHCPDEIVRIYINIHQKGRKPY